MIWGAAAVRCSAGIAEGASAACLVVFAMVGRLTSLALAVQRCRTEGSGRRPDPPPRHRRSMQPVMLSAMSIAARPAPVPECVQARGSEHRAASCSPAICTFSSRCRKLRSPSPSPALSSVSEAHPRHSGAHAAMSPRRQVAMACRTDTAPARRPVAVLSGQHEERRGGCRRYAAALRNSCSIFVL